nr:hypothetical protein [Micromonospora sp. RTP1Z1]
MLLEPGEQRGDQTPGRRAARRVRQHDDAVSGVAGDAQLGDEARHRPAVAGVPASVDVEHLPADPVRTRPRDTLVVDDEVRLAHLLERVGGEQLAGVAGEESGPPREVLDRGPQLARGAHRAGVVLGLGQEDVGKGCTARPRAARPVGRLVVRPMPSGSSRSRRKTSNQSTPWARATS